MAKLYSENPVLSPGHQDQSISREIIRKLNSAITWDTSDIHVSVDEGSVLLTGTVADAKAMEQSVLVVFTVKEVKKIINKMKIRRDGNPGATRTGMTPPAGEMPGDNQHENE